MFSKSAYFNLTVKVSVVNLLNTWVVIYLELLGILFSTSLISVFKIVAVTKLLVFGVLFSASPNFCIQNSCSP